MTPTLLAFDTSTDRMSLSLSGPHGVWLHESEGGARASARLIPEALALLAEAGLALTQLDAIAFGCGPGAFTGLRTACAVAQGFAFGANKPVLPVDSLMLVAEDARGQLGEAAIDAGVWVAMDARMDEAYAAAYRWHPNAGRWEVVESPALYAVDALRLRWEAAPPATVAGSALTAFGARLNLSPVTRTLGDAQSRAAALSRLAPLLWAQGAALDAALALPVYVRNKVAQTTAEREAVRNAQAGVSA